MATHQELSEDAIEAATLRGYLVGLYDFCTQHAAITKDAGKKEAYKKVADTIDFLLRDFGKVVH